MVHIIVKTGNATYTSVTVGGSIQDDLTIDETLGNCASVLYRERPQFSDTTVSGTAATARRDANVLTDVAEALIAAAGQVITARNARLAALIKES